MLLVQFHIASYTTSYAITFHVFQIFTYSTMPTCCSVPECSNRGGVTFPKDPTVKKKWVVAMRRDKWTPKTFSIICHSHFQASDYYGPETYHGRSLFFNSFY